MEVIPLSLAIERSAKEGELRPTGLGSEAGVSMISVLVAIILLSFGVLAFAQTASLALSMGNIASTRSTALGIASSHMEFLKSQNPNNLQSEAEVRVDENGQLLASGKFGRETVVLNIGTRLVEVQVSVTYPGGEEPLELKTLSFQRR